MKTSKKKTKAHVYNQDCERIVEMLQRKTGIKSAHFLRTLVIHYFSVMASMQRATVTDDIGETSMMNLYTMALAPSGTGKNYSTDLIEKSLLAPFTDAFTELTLPNTLYANIQALAKKHFVTTTMTVDELMDELAAEHAALGTYTPMFGDATSAAIHQLRRKVQIAGAGSLNLVVDEIGDVIISLNEVLTDYLSLYESGLIKQKILKVSKDALRGIIINDATPATFLAFGSQNKLLNDPAIEQYFMEKLRSGYARRYCFAYLETNELGTELSPEEIYEIRAAATTALGDLSRYAELGSYSMFGFNAILPKEIMLELIKYEIRCKTEASKLGEYDELRKIELINRPTKVRKIAGIFAFISKSKLIKKSHIREAVNFIEESGKHFRRMIQRTRPHEKLAQYIVSKDGKAVTKHNFIADLPFYTGTSAAKKEMIEDMYSFAYSESMMITRKIVNNTEVFTGKKLIPTDLDNLKFSISYDITEGYQNGTASFEGLVDVVTMEDMHFITHFLRDGDKEIDGVYQGYRKNENIIGSFNMIALDFDDGTTIEEASNVMGRYKHLIYTTKRHTGDLNRFRMIIPLSHELSLNKDDFSAFMVNIFKLLPFKVDTAAKDIARKWLTNNGDVYINDDEDTELFPSMYFLPDTRKAAEIIANVTNFEKDGPLFAWFVHDASDGNRNNSLARYAFILIDKGYGYEDIIEKVKLLNDVLNEPLTLQELEETVFVTVKKATKYVE